MFGSFEGFLSLLFQLDKVRIRNNILIEEALKKQLKEEEEKHQKFLQDFVSSINNYHHEVAVLLLKGSFISNESYKKLRLLLSFNLNPDHSVVLRCSLPKIALPFQDPMYVE